MDLIKVLIENIDNIALVIGLIISTGLLIKKGETKKLKEILFSLITEVEQKYGKKTGALKYAEVANLIYSKIPPFMQLLFTEKDIRNMIEAVLAEAKKKWEANSSLKHYIENPQDIISKEELTNAASELAEIAINNAKEQIKKDSPSEEGKTENKPTEQPKTDKEEDKASDKPKEEEKVEEKTSEEPKAEVTTETKPEESTNKVEETETVKEEPKTEKVEEKPVEHEVVIEEKQE